jgi:hypothetical protein
LCYKEDGLYIFYYSLRQSRVNGADAIKDLAVALDSELCCYQCRPITFASCQIAGSRRAVSLPFSFPGSLWILYGTSIVHFMSILLVHELIKLQKFMIFLLHLKQLR